MVMFSSSLVATLLVVVLVATAKGDPDPLDAVFPRCDQRKGRHSKKKTNSFVPGLYVVSSNLPGATIKKDGTLAHRNIVCAHEDRRTSGGTVVIPWAAFDKHDENGNGRYDWKFVRDQMKPWIERGQMVNLLVWPAVQKEDQRFPNGKPATPQYILDTPGMTFLCPNGTTQGTGSVGTLPLPKFWEPEVFKPYRKALRDFVRRFEGHPNVNYFRFGIGVGAESYPANGATTPKNFCMETFKNQFPGSNDSARADNAFRTWKDHVTKMIKAFRRFKSKKRIVVTINDFKTKPGQGANDFPNLVAREATKVDKGLPKLGLGVQGATTLDIGRWEERKRCNANWCALFNQNKNAGIPLQLQTPTHSGVYGPPGPDNPIAECKGDNNRGKFGCMDTGNIAELIAFALKRGVKSFELYAYEWLVANDNGFSKDPMLDFHELFGSQYRSALNSASNRNVVR